jgi:Putative transposase
MRGTTVCLTTSPTTYSADDVRTAGRRLPCLCGCTRVEAASMVRAGSPAGWISCRPDFFLHVRVLGRLFRHLFLKYLQEAFDAGKLQFFSTLEACRERRAFLRYLAPARKSKWVVYAKPPFAGPEDVLRYAARYTHRVAISNDRVLDALRSSWATSEAVSRPSSSSLAIAGGVSRSAGSASDLA